MVIHEAFFYSVVFFLIGVLFASFKLNFAIIVLSTFLIAIVFLFTYFLRHKNNVIDVHKLLYFSILSLFIIIGAFYYNFYIKNQTQEINISFDEKIDFNGIVIDYPQRGKSQKLAIELQTPYSGKILANVQPYPSYNYGDLIKFEGTIKKPEPKYYANYLEKDGLFGITNFPKTELISSNNGSYIKSKLFQFKEGIVANFQKTLPSEKAAFLSGITLGERAEFSKELKDKMSKSGTTHLVALSGQNITIIVIIISSFFRFFTHRRLVFLFTLLIIIFFVLMTGAEASVVRAAIMGGIILLAKQIGRAHSMRNAIAAAGLIMILYNPLILRFDLGFQLSFLALIGIVYLSPIIRKILKLKEGSGFLAWRENFLTTISAQFAVLPLILFNFGIFSPFFLPANILILTIIPMTMIFGFILGALGFIYLPIASFFGWFVGLFLSYELTIINIFSSLSF